MTRGNPVKDDKGKPVMVDQKVETQSHSDRPGGVV